MQQCWKNRRSESKIEKSNRIHTKCYLIVGKKIYILEFRQLTRVDFFDFYSSWRKKSQRIYLHIMHSSVWIVSIRSCKAIHVNVFKFGLNIIPTNTKRTCYNWMDSFDSWSGVKCVIQVKKNKKQKHQPIQTGKYFGSYVCGFFRTLHFWCHQNVI